jgi:hypothetical protein
MTRNTYKENAQLAESYKINTAEIERLKKLNKTMQAQYDQARAENEENAVLAKDRVDLVAKQAKQMREVSFFS